MKNKQHDFGETINKIIAEGINNFKEELEFIYLKAYSDFNLKKRAKSFSIINNTLIENYIKKKGYTENTVLGDIVWVKGFTCVSLGKGYIEIWHDKTNNPNHLFIRESMITGLPITLRYMERI